MKKSFRNIVVLVLVALLFYFSRDLVDWGSLTPVVTPAPAVESATVEEGAVGDYYTAFFTNPPTEFSATGIEGNLISLIDSAKESVHGAMFELDLPDVVSALLSAKSRGVDVKLVYDNEQMTDADRAQILAKLKSAGIPMIPDKRSAFMHNKFFVIDGKTLWTGSFNFTQNAAHKNNENAVIFRVPELAANYEREFSEMFAGQFGPKSTPDTPYPAVTVNGYEIDNYFAPEDGVMPKVIAAVKSAENSVDFLSFSFTDVDLAYTMSELAMEKDVDVRGVFETRQSSGSVCSYLMLRNENIEGNGSIKVKLDGNSGTMHEKVIIIDGRIVIFGSFNFSGNANDSNDENLLIVNDPALAAKFEQEFGKVFDQAVTPTDGCKKP